MVQIRRILFPPISPTRQTTHSACAVPGGEDAARQELGRRAAGEEQGELVVMARRGSDSLGDELFGSTTDRVLRRAPCPVLVA